MSKLNLTDKLFFLRPPLSVIGGAGDGHGWCGPTRFKEMCKLRTGFGFIWPFLGNQSCDSPVVSYFETCPASKPIIMVTMGATRLAAPAGPARCPSTPVRPPSPDEDRKARELRRLQREVA